MRKIVSLFVTLMSISVLFASCKSDETEVSVADNKNIINIKNAEDDSETVLEQNTTEEEIQVQYPCKRAYESYLDFECEYIDFADDSAIKALKEQYAELEFECEFKQGNTDEFDFYIGKFYDFLHNEIPYYNTDTGENRYFRDEFPEIEENLQQNIAYYLFDMDEDGAPELGVSRPDWSDCDYIFKYDVESDSVFLWKDVQAYTLLGSRALYWERNRIFSFYKLDENGDEFITATFHVGIDYEKEEEVFLVEFPQVKNEEIQLPDEILAQGFYEIAHDSYYFRVTEELFDELRTPLFEKIIPENINSDSVTYTYEELFGATKNPSYELYYGEWEISETIYVDPVPTHGTEYTEEEIEDAKKFYYENAEIRKIKFTPDEIVINEKEIYDEIMYTYVVFPADIDYNIHFTMTLKDIGLTEDNAGYYLFVKAESGNSKTVIQFFIKDSNTIIAYCGGSYCIEYNKVSESGNDSEVLIIVG